MSEPEGFLDDFTLDPTVLLGAWANSTSVRRGRDELTIDFLRDVPELSRHVLVVRALLPPVAAFELRDQLTEALRHYTEWSMPEDENDG